MEVIKLINPTEEYIDNSLNEQEVEDLFKQINEAVFTEGKIRTLSEDTAELAIYGGFTVAVVIAMIVKYIKNKYRLTTQKMIDQAKELNDLYTKIDAMLKTDKMIRFKHRNDRIDTTKKNVYMMEKNNHNKVYYLRVDFYGFDPQWFIDQINDIVSYANSAENKSKELETLKEELLKKIKDDFRANHGYLLTCTPIIKEEQFKNQKLETVIMSQKNSFSAWYENIYTIDKYTGATLQYMQYMQQAYNKMLAQYGKDKEHKKMVDDIFKELLKNFTISMDFNNKSLELCTEVLKYYAEELQKIYDMLKS